MYKKGIQKFLEIFSGKFFNKENREKLTVPKSVGLRTFCKFQAYRTERIKDKIRLKQLWAWREIFLEQMYNFFSPQTQHPLDQKFRKIAVKKNLVYYITYKASYSFEQFSLTRTGQL